MRHVCILSKIQFQRWNARKCKEFKQGTNLNTYFPKSEHERFSRPSLDSRAC